MEQLQALGSRLLRGEDALRWPPPAVQAQYTGTSGELLLAKSIAFIRLLVAQVPKLGTGDWRGLEYGVGWGRLASLMTHYGPPAQLDCVDAWARSLDHARNCGLTNRLTQVGSVLARGEIAPGTYDFIYAYSIFTHLSARPTANNIARLYEALAPGGVLLFTVRDPNFVDFLRGTGNYRPCVDGLESIGYWFGNVHSPDYGDSIFTIDWLRRETRGLGWIERVGPLALEPTQVVMSLRKPARTSS